MSGVAGHLYRSITARRSGFATPLLVVLETADVTFTVRSIPAILGNAPGAFIRNVLVRIGLRAISVALAGFVRRFTASSSTIFSVFDGRQNVPKKAWWLSMPLLPGTVGTILPGAGTEATIMARRLFATFRHPYPSEHMKLLRLATAGLLLAPAFTNSAAAQALDPTFSPPTGLFASAQVYSLGSQQADGKTVVAGYITRANGAAVNAVVRLDAAGALDQPFSQNVGPASNVYHVKNLPNGQYLLGANEGNITAGGLTRAALLRLNANGTADAAFDTGSGTALANGTLAGYVVEYAAQPDGKVVAVGSFAKFNGTNAPGVVRLNANGSVDTGFSVGMGFDAASTGNAVAIQADGKILVGGDFSSFNGQPAEGLVRLNADGSRDNTFLFSAPQSSYNNVEGLLLQSDGKILVNGSISDGPASFQGLVRLLPSGSIDTGFSAAAFIGTSLSTGGLSPAVQLQPDGKILIIGNFSAPGAHKVARLNPNGSQDMTFAVGAGPNGRPGALALQANGSVLFGGAVITSFNGHETPLGRLTSTGAPDAAYAPTLQVPGNVAVLAYQPDGKVLIAGNFSEVNGQAVQRLARLTAAGAFDASFAPTSGILTSPVSCLALQPDGKVLAGNAQGTFRFDANGTQDQTFSSSLSTTALALQADGKVLIGGNFITPTHRYLARVTSTGANDPTFVRPIGNTGPGLPKEVDAIVVQPDGRIVVAELFGTSIMELPTIGRVVRYETSGALDASFNNMSAFTPFTNQNVAFVGAKRVFSLTLQPDGKILAGGNFTGVSGTYHPRVVRLLANGTVDPTFGSNALLTGTVYSVALQPNGRVLLGGEFANPGTSGTLSNLARVLDDGQSDASFTGSTSPNNAVRALAVQPNGAILLAGSFVTVGGQPAMGVARIAAPNVLLGAASAAVAARTAAWPVPAREVLHVAPDASAHPRSIELLDALGRSVRHLPATGTATVAIDTEHLPTGMYLLRVNYAAGTVTRRIAVQ